MDFLRDAPPQFLGRYFRIRTMYKGTLAWHANATSGVGGMTEHPTFNGFFSYAHHDAETDSKLIADFTSELERRVASKLTNARFAIWRDNEGLRTGERWNEKIEAQLRRSDILIVFLTPNGSIQTTAAQNTCFLKI
jgi:hypothetical protein